MTQHDVRSSSQTSEFKSGQIVRGVTIAVWILVAVVPLQTIYENESLELLERCTEF